MSTYQGGAVVAAGVTTLFAQADFSGTITLGSIVVAVVVLAGAALFTIRSNIATVWRQQAEGQEARADDLQRKLDEQQVVRHDLKDQIATLNAQLLVERSKPDLSLLLKTSEAHNINITKMIGGVVETQSKMLTVLVHLKERE